jgi:hypothetical protein
VGVSLEGVVKRLERLRLVAPARVRERLRE